MTAGPSAGIFGASPRRVDAGEKVSGQARYVDDLVVPGTWFGGTLRSAVPRGTLRGVVRSADFDWSRVTVITAADLPGPNEVAMIRKDYPILVDRNVQFVGQPLALVAAPDRKTLAAALRALSPDVEEEHPVLTVEEALEGRTVIWGSDNVLAAYTIGEGDMAAGFAQA